VGDDLAQQDPHFVGFSFLSNIKDAQLSFLRSVRRPSSNRLGLAREKYYAAEIRAEVPSSAHLLERRNRSEVRCSLWADSAEGGGALLAFSCLTDGNGLAPLLRCSSGSPLARGALAHTLVRGHRPPDFSGPPDYLRFLEGLDVQERQRKTERLACLLWTRSRGGLAGC
jgi:hypothetical protein